MEASTRVTPFAAVTGTLWLSSPNISHSKVPKVNSRYMTSDMEEVSFVFIVFMAWGTKEIVVQNAATSPHTVI